MNRIIRVYAFLTFFLMGIATVNAQGCSYKEKAQLNKAAGLIKTNNEIKEEREYKIFQDVDDLSEYQEMVIIPTYILKIYNITSDIYITITNDVNDEVRTIKYEDTTEGIYTFENKDDTKITNYLVEVNSNIESCVGETIKRIKFTKPITNPFSLYGVCQDHESFKYCKPYTYEEFDISLDSLAKAVYEYDQKSTVIDNKPKEENILDFVKKNKVYFIIGGIVLAVGIGTGVIIYRKKRII